MSGWKINPLKVAECPVFVVKDFSRLYRLSKLNRLYKLTFHFLFSLTKKSDTHAVGHSKNYDNMNNAKNLLTEIRTFRQTQNSDLANTSILLNEGVHRHASGKLAEYKKLLAVCKFKLVVYWKFDKWGRPYTIEEKKQRRHRRDIPSNDIIRSIKNEEQAYFILLEKCIKQFNRLDGAQIFLIDRIEGVEHMVFKFDIERIALSQETELEFKDDNFGNRYFSKMLSEPLRTDQIR